MRERYAYSLAGLAAAVVMASAASADINLNFQEVGYFQGNFDPQFDAPLVGQIDTIVGDFQLDEGENFTYADDLAILIANESLTEVLFQVGGYTSYANIMSPDTNLGHFSWEFGGGAAPGTVGGGTVDVGGIDVTGWYLYLGHGYGAGGEGFWSGSIDFQGSVVPAPGAIALFGLAGFAARRRRA